MFRNRRHQKTAQHLETTDRIHETKTLIWGKKKNKGKAA